MAYGKILVPLQGEDSELYALETALSLARDAGARMEAMFMAQDPREAGAYMVGFETANFLPQMMAEIAELNKKHAKHAWDLFNKALSKTANVTANPGFSAELTERVGSGWDLVTRYGRVSDIIVSHRPANALSSDEFTPLNAALRSTGRPVFLVPKSVQVGFARRIGIAWNGSIEAARAVGCAIPFLEHADEILIFIIEDRATKAISGEDLADYLSCHGAKAKIVRRGPSSHRSEGEEILVASAIHALDMLVLGAYTHSDVRRFLFGGVTGDVISQTEIPLLLAH
jgi:nucleotide-binding universal stress UspA family protein